MSKYILLITALSSGRNGRSSVDFDLSTHCSFALEVPTIMFCVGWNPKFGFNASYISYIIRGAGFLVHL